MKICLERAHTQKQLENNENWVWWKIVEKVENCGNCGKCVFIIELSWLPVLMKLCSNKILFNWMSARFFYVPQSD